MSDNTLDNSKAVRTTSPTLKPSHYPQLFPSFQAQPPSEEAIIYANSLYERARRYGPGVKSKPYRMLRMRCTNVGILPLPCHLDNNQLKINDSPFASGGYSDMWRGLYKGEGVAIKGIRANTSDNIERMTKDWCGRIMDLYNLSHPHIVPFLGVISTDSLPLGIVCNWMQNGNISEFLKRDGRFDRRPLLLDIVRGLEYLHQESVVHGDLKGSNILIDNDNRAVLCDFGLAFTTADAKSAHTSTMNGNGSIRWMAPERLSIFDGSSEPAPGAMRVTEESDMYSLAMVVVEVFTGNPPFSDTPDAGVILKLCQHERPMKPEGAAELGLTNPIWETVEMCWKTQPSDRPDAYEVLGIWEKEIGGGDPL